MGLGLPHHLARLDLLVFHQDQDFLMLLFGLLVLVDLGVLEVQPNHLVQVNLVPLVHLRDLYSLLDQGFQLPPRIKLRLVKHDSN